MAEDRINYRDEIAGEIIRAIEAGTAPWQRPWKPNEIGARPFNPLSGKPYRGINDLWLSLRGHADPRWMTYRQALELGGQVLKGEKSATIEYWQWSERKPALGEDGKPLVDVDGNRQYVEARLDRPRVFYAKVFNASQIAGLEPWIGPAPAFDPIERAEALLAGCTIPIFHDQADRAFYSPWADQIHLNPRADFKDAAAYYGTALHEVGHGTGHESRLAREFGPFGSEVYAREELRAEISSYMLARDLGIGHDPSRHAAYVESWLKALKEDRNEIFRAARDAEEIKTWVMEPEWRPELEHNAQARVAAAQAEEHGMTETPAVRVYLSVPFSERDAVKQAGAKFDGSAKRWYVPEGKDPAAFVHWADLPKQAPADRSRAATSPAASPGEIAARIERSQLVDLPRGLATLEEMVHRHAGLSVETLKGPLDELGEGVSPQDIGEVMSREGISPADTERLIQRAEIGASWFVHAAQNLNLPETAELPHLLDNLGKITMMEQNHRVALRDGSLPEWEPERFAPPDQLAWVLPFRDQLVGHSREYAELISAMVDSHIPGQKTDRFPGYIPPEQRTNDLVRELTRENQPDVAIFDTPASPIQSVSPGASPLPEPAKRIFLAVPFAEKNKAKALGAQWSKRDKSWWVPEGTDLSPFEKWSTGTAKVASADVSPVAEFGDALRAHGLLLEGAPAMDGKWHRVQVEGDRKGQFSGSYVGYLPKTENDRAAGLITNWKAGVTADKWVAAGATLSAEQKAELQAQAAQIREQREADRRQAAEVAARKAYGVWVNLPDGASPDTCAYLAAKGVEGHGVKVAQDGHLVVPQRDADGRLWGVQFCSPEGKRYLKDNLHTGTMHVIDPSGKGTLDAITTAMGGTIIIAEGYATAATLHEATGRPVVVAFDSGNLEAVVRAVAQRHPERERLIAADNDHGVILGGKPVNVGMVKAEAVAKATGSRWTAPKFNDDEKARKLTDFNDLAASRGKSAVKAAIDAALTRNRTEELERGIA